MEVFVAKFDYEKEREDLLSFKEGEKFRIASKADKKWWAAYCVETGNYGYVPSSYMEVSRMDWGLSVASEENKTVMTSNVCMGC